MSNEPNKGKSTQLMLSQLVLVTMGLLALLLLAVVAGAIADRYYTRRQYEKSVELDRQEAFAQGVTYEEYVRARKEREEAERRAAQQQFASASQQTDTSGLEQGTPMPQQAGTAVDGQSAVDQVALPKPDFDVSLEEIQGLMRMGAVIHTTLGSIPLEFRPDLAPKAVKNFFYLASKGFYDGMAFYRVNPAGFVQTGSPTGLLGGTAGYSEPLERNNLLPDKGTLAFIPSAGEEEFGSEFCIFLSDVQTLIGQVTVFGRIKDRLDVVEKISDSKFDGNGYLADRAYVTRVEIVVKKAPAAAAAPPAE